MTKKKSNNDVLNSVADKMTAVTPPAKGVVSKDAALKFVNSISFELGNTAFGWHTPLDFTVNDGVIRVLSDKDGRFTREGKEIGEGEDKRPTRDGITLVKQLILNALTTGALIEKYNVYIPGVNESLNKEDKLLSTKALVKALTDMKDITVIIKASKYKQRKAYYPSIMLFSKVESNSSSDAALASFGDMIE